MLGLVGLGLALALLTSGCAGSPSQPATRRSAPASLDTAIRAVSRARAQLLPLPAALTQARTALDDADAACATGSVSAARAARAPVEADLAAASSALAALPGRAKAYRSALPMLTSARRPVAAPQQQALQAVADAGTAEAQADEALDRTVVASQDTYTALDTAQRSWLERAAAGWYRTQSEAAAAYEVFVQPQRPSLAAAQSAVQAANARSESATRAQRSALAAADAALGRSG